MRRIVIILLVCLSGCTMTFNRNNLCELPRPKAALNDTLSTKKAQDKASKLWDKHCTLFGAW